MRTRLGHALASLTDTALGKLALVLAVATVGWLPTQFFDVGDLTHSQIYVYLATGLLAVGLYSSTQGIDVGEARHNLRTVLIAVTLGVIAKAVLISGLMYAVFRRPEYLVLGVAIAQIDPLSVATMRMRSRMSERAKAILLTWASFDDPVTTLLTIYLSGVTLSIINGGQLSGRGVSDGSLLSFGSNLLQSFAFAGVAFALWVLLKRGWRWTEKAAPGESATSGRGRFNMCAIAVLLGLFATAVWQFLMLGLALTGLFFRPAMGKWVDRLTHMAFLLAVLVLGLLLGPGIDLARGAVLGVTAFAAQAVVAVLIARRQTRTDQVYLALGQQNGITAIILALLLEPDFPGTVAIVAPAILVVNVLNIVSNAAWDHWDTLLARVPGRAAPQARPAVARTVPVAPAVATPRLRSAVVPLRPDHSYGSPGVARRSRSRTQ